MRCDRRGTTLLELLVVLVILAMIAGVAGLAVGAARGGDREEDWRGVVTAARREAIRTGRAVQVRIRARRDDASSPAIATTDSIVVSTITALPDGSVLAPRGVAVSRLSGRPLRVAAAR